MPSILFILLKILAVHARFTISKITAKKLEPFTREYVCVKEIIMKVAEIFRPERKVIVSNYWSCKK
jgi:hypothetical protein